MDEKHEKDLIFSNGFNSLKKCRYGMVLYNYNDIYVGKSFDCYDEFSEKESEDLFKAMFIETVGVLFVNFLNVVN